MMYHLSVSIRTKPENPEHGIVGQSLVEAWVEAETKDIATQLTRSDITESDWELIEIEGPTSCNDETYDQDDEYREFYEKAKTGEPIFVYYKSPRYPAYFFKIQVASSNSADNNDAKTPSDVSNSDNANKLDDTNESKDANEALAWIVNETVCNEYDPFEKDFWSGQRLERALGIVSDTITDNGYSVVKVLDQQAMGLEDVVEHRNLYLAAEQDGLCVVFVQDLQAN
jgi:hypothetical protein